MIYCELRTDRPTGLPMGSETCLAHRSGIRAAGDALHMIGTTGSRIRSSYSQVLRTHNAFRFGLVART